MTTRRATLDLSCSLLARFLHSGTGLVELVAHALPADARIVDVRMSGRHADVLHLLVESESFAEVAHGERFPNLPSPQFKRASSPTPIK